MSLFSNKGSKVHDSCYRSPNVINNSLFRESEKIINITKIVTGAVTKNIEAINLLYDNLYNDVGSPIRNLFNAFVNGSDDLKILINF